jgi:hypothetical protein
MADEQTDRKIGGNTEGMKKTNQTHINNAIANYEDTDDGVAVAPGLRFEARA